MCGAIANYCCAMLHVVALRVELLLLLLLRLSHASTNALVKTTTGSDITSAVQHGNAHSPL